MDDQPIRIKLKIGEVEVEIECKKEEVKSVVDTILESIQERQEKLTNLISKPTLRHLPKRKTCKGIILDLWNEGWFSTIRLLGEICEELEKRGYHFDRTAVAHSLLDLVREGYLKRIGTARNFRYIQNNPS
jgi:hypothetical protein